MKRLYILFALLLVVGIGAVIWWKNGLQPVNMSDKTPKIFVVTQQEGVREIASQLKEQGLIRDPIVFFLLTRKLGLDGQLQAGDFRLNPSMSTYDVAQALTHGMLDIWVTIPEGKRSDEIADILQLKVPTYQESWRKILDANEGYLFPDTYLIPKDATAETVIAQMKSNFDTKYALAVKEKTDSLTESDAVILASIIQREAITPSDMRMVSSVLQNRLQIGMALGSDVTLEYALGYQPNEKSWWKKDLTVFDLKLATPYNTRLNAGLPPTPISNPGLVALQAALNPSKSNYMYYLSDKNGKLHFATTIEEHNANIQKYQVQ